MKKQNNKGFTLVELVIVIAVIAILAGVLIGTLASVIARANQSKEMQEQKNGYTEFLVDLDYGTAAGVEASQAKYVIVGSKYAFVADAGQFNSTALNYVVNATATSGVAGTVTKATEHLFVGLEDYTIVTEVPEATTTEQKYAIALTTPGYTNYYIIGVVAATVTEP